MCMLKRFYTLGNEMMSENYVRSLITSSANCTSNVFSDKVHPAQRPVSFDQVRFVSLCFYFEIFIFRFTAGLLLRHVHTSVAEGHENFCSVFVGRTPDRPLEHAAGDRGRVRLSLECDAARLVR